MKIIYSGILRTVVTLCVLAQPWQPMLCSLAAAEPEGTLPAASANEGDSTVATTSDSPAATTKASSIGMRGIVLPKAPLTMDFQDADVRDVLHLLAIKSGINFIYGADVVGPISIHLDRVPFDQAFQTILTLKALVALPMGPRVIRVISSTTLLTEQSQAATFTRVFRLNYADAGEVRKPIDAIRLAAGRKGVSTVDSKTNALIITDTIEGLKEVEDLIPVLDKKPQQVDIETKIVEVSLDNETDTGISWAYAGSGGPHDSYKIGGTSSQTGGTTPGYGGGSGTTSIPVMPTGGSGSSSGSSGSGSSSSGSSGSSGGSLIGTGVSLNSIPSGPTPVGLSFLTQQGTYLLSAQISALATQGRVKILSTPHIVTTNNEEARISVADQIPYTVTTVSNGISQSAVQFISAGVKLSVKPTVNADRRITLHVKPEVSNAVGTGSAVLPPTVNTRDADTTVVLRDGETIAIGGLIQENINKTVTGIPFLMSIPILGYLFKTISDRKQRTELIVFLTPKIAAE